MQVGMIGLGRMGANMARRFARGGAHVTAWDAAAKTRGALTHEKGTTAVSDLASRVKRLKSPRVVWLMLPAGKSTDDTLAKLLSLLAKGDVVVDGANAYYKDSMRRAAELATQGLHFVDAGVSGGIWGLTNGYAVTLGGKTPNGKARYAFHQTARPTQGLAALRT